MIWPKKKGSNSFGVSKTQVFLLPGIFCVAAVLVLALWIWPMHRQMASVKEDINSLNAELSQVKNRKREILNLRLFAQEHGNDPARYVEEHCFKVASKEEIVPFLMDYLPGLGGGFYLFSWSATQDEPSKIGELGSRLQLYRTPVHFGFSGYVVEAMGFIASLKGRRGIWVNGVTVERKPGNFPSYKVDGGACFVVEER